MRRHFEEAAINYDKQPRSDRGEVLESRAASNRLALEGAAQDELRVEGRPVPDDQSNIVISTRRFFALPSSLSLGARGREEPKPR